MTKEEAKTKWCPMFQVSGINERGGSKNNRGGDYWCEVFVTKMTKKHQKYLNLKAQEKHCKI